MKFSPTCKFLSLAGIGAVLASLGAILLGVWPTLFDFILSKYLALTPNSYSYDFWKNVPVPVYMEFYIFNWTNPEDINNPDPAISRPKFVEMGPYVYREKRQKVVLGWNTYNNTVAFYQNRTWHFVPELSNESPDDDNITTLSVPALAAAFVLRNYPIWVKKILNVAYKFLGTSLFVQMKVRQFLFDGHDDIFLVLGDLLNRLIPGFLPLIIPFDKFGLFYPRNGSETYEGLFNMFTGKGDMKKFGQMDNWNGESSTDLYDDVSCSRVNGSAGEFFPPRPKKGGKQYVFSADICRSIYLQYKEETKVDGIPVYRYWGDEHVFKNATERPENWCYCPSGECAPSGAIDISRCKWGIPAFVSFPHFLHGDPSYTKAVEGMKPNVDKHKMFADLEKNSGIPVQGVASLQINMRLSPYPEYELLSRVPKLYFPLAWFRQRAELNDEMRKMMQIISYAPLAAYILFGTITCVGVLGLIISSACYLNFVKKRKRRADDSKS